MRKNRMLLIGWDAADWQMIEPLMREGKMPVLESFINSGVSGNIATLSPALSPILWTSIATGKRAYDHGICGFVENDPASGEVVPVKSTSRKCKAVWNILEEAGLRSNLVNWWPSYPAEILSGVSVSNHFHKSAPSGGGEWPLEESVIHPEQWYEKLKELRLHPSELSLAHVEPFIPEAAKLNPAKYPVLNTMIRILAQCSSIHNAATLLMEDTQWDFMAVYYEAIDHFSHLSMKYHPPKPDGVDEEEFHLYKGIMEGAYRFHDMMLGRLLELAGDDCDVILLSDHGFHSGSLREPNLPDLPAAPALEHRKYGIFAAKGPSFKSAEKLYGASLLDVAPTILHAFGLPVGEDMEGKVLQDIFKHKQSESKIPSWEMSEKKPRFVEEASSGKAVLDQLEELGYVDLNKDDKFQYVEQELLYNLCTSLLDGGKLKQAAEKSRQGWEKNYDMRFGILLSESLLQDGALDELAKVLEEIGKYHRGNAGILFFKGLLALQRNEQRNALEYFQSIEGKGPVSIQLFNQIGRSFLILGNLKAAISYFDKSLSLDANNASALTSMAQCLLEENQPEEALELLDKSLQLTFYQPNAHYLMAQAALKINMTELAVNALQLCLHQAPKHYKAAALLSKIGGNISKEEKPPIIAVSGFPRSGTSMLMNILKQGGVEIFEDQERKEDIHNPEGYFEHHKVKSLGRQNEWIAEARGKAMKVVTPLLRYLPATEKFKVLLLKRPLTEVIISQEVMKGRDRAAVLRYFPFQLAVDLQNEEQRVLNWLKMQPNIDFMEVDFYRCLEDPEAIIAEIESFIGLKLNLSAAKAAIKPHLHRNKFGKS